MEREGDPLRSVVVLAIDEQEAVYTVRDVQTGELLLMTWEPDMTWHYLTLTEDGA